MAKPIIRLDLRGEDGNIFFVAQHAIQALRHAGPRTKEQDEQVDAIGAGVMTSHSYEEAMNKIREYVEIVDLSYEDSYPNE